VKQAAHHVRELPMLNISSLASQQQHENQVLQLLSRCNLKRFAFMEQAEVTESARVLILGQTNEAEQLSACLVLQTMMQQKLQQEALVVRTVKDMQQHIPTAQSLVIVLSRGLFENPDFAAMLLEALGYHRWESPCCEMEPPTDSNNSMWMVGNVSSIGSYRSMPMQRTGTQRSQKSCGSTRMGALKIILVNADTGFDFPGAEFYKKVQNDGLGNSMSKDELARVCRAYQQIIRRIALPFACHASEGLIEHQIAAICERFHDQDRSSVPTHSFRRHTSVGRDAVCSAGEAPESWPSEREAQDETDDELGTEEVV